MAILTSKRIREEIKNNHIRITGFDKDRLGPNSYDLTLFKKISYYSDDKYLDTRNPCQDLETFEIPEDGITLFPRRLYLCKTNETVWSDKYIMELSGLSSLARLGIVVHQTAGYANIGHEFQWVLEVTVTHPVKIYPNMRIAQQYFHTVEGDVELYNGRYKYKQLDDNICASLPGDESDIWSYNINDVKNFIYDGLFNLNESIDNMNEYFKNSIKSENMNVISADDDIK